MGETTTRLLTAAFCIVYTLGLICINIYATSLYYLSLILVSLTEYHYQIDTTKKKITITLSTIMYLLFNLKLLDLIQNKHVTLCLPIIMSLFAIELFSNDITDITLNNSMLNLGSDLLGLVWICIPLYLALDMSYPLIDGVRTHNPTIIIGIMFFVFLSDAGAYFVGKYFGKNKLFPTISPKKTWEGSIGGAIASSLSIYPIQHYFTILSTHNWIIIYIICVVCGAVGDLVESMIKRNLKIKDTGNVLPGHGGVLDRIDGLLYSLPFIYTYLVLIN